MRAITFTLALIFILSQGICYANDQAIIDSSNGAKHQIVEEKTTVLPTIKDDAKHQIVEEKNTELATTESLKSEVAQNEAKSPKIKKEHIVTSSPITKEELDSLESAQDSMMEDLR